MKKSRVFLIVTLVMMILTTTLAVGFGAGTPGSEDDPIVTKSYVDKVVNALEELLGEEIDEVKSDMDDMKDDIEELQKEEGTTSGSTGWQVVRVPANTTVVGETGTEMILRSGSASAVDNGKNGISDLTGGKDLRMGTSITLNHLLLIPGSDGRGIKTVGECFVMINGGYTLVSPEAPKAPETPAVTEPVDNSVMPDGI